MKTLLVNVTTLLISATGPFDSTLSPSEVLLPSALRAMTVAPFGKMRSDTATMGVRSSSA